MKFFRHLLLMLPLLAVGLAAQAQVPTDSVRMNGLVLRNGSAWPNHAVRIIRTTDNAGNFDSTQFSVWAYTDAGGYFTRMVPRATTRNTEYLIFTNGCQQGQNGLWQESIAPSDSFAVGGRFEFTCGTPPPCRLDSTDALFTVNAFDLNIAATINLSTANVTNSWSFGDGSPIADGLSCGHTYALPGRYTICHTVTDINNPSCAATSCQMIVVGDTNRIPVTIISQVQANGQCFQDSVLIEFFGADGTQYFGDVFSDSSCYSAVSVTPGCYLVRYTPMGRLARLGYLPTYYGGGITWDSTHMVCVGSGGQGPFLVVNLARRDSSVGNGSLLRVNLHGNGIRFNSPVAQAHDQIFWTTTSRLLLLSASGRKLGWTAVDGNGSVANFNVAPGDYIVRTEFPFMGGADRRVQISSAGTMQEVDFYANASGMSVTALRGRSLETLSAYPNPARSAIKVRLASAKGAAELALIGSDGRIARTLSVANAADGAEVSVAGLPAGIYHLQLIQNGAAVASARVQVVK